MGLDRVGDRVVHYTVTDAVQQTYQSDRPYPPFVSVPLQRDTWYDPTSGVERSVATYGGLSGGYQPPPLVNDRFGTYQVTDTALVPDGDAMWSEQASRPLNAWLEVGEFRASPDIHVVARCEFRDDRTIAVARKGVWGEERLLLDARTDLPIGMTREEPDYLWGQVRATYVYSLWDQLDTLGGLRPRSAIRMSHGAVDIERMEGTWAIAPRDSLPLLPRKTSDAAMSVDEPLFLQPTAVDTVPVHDGVRILHNLGYSEGLVMAHDTVFLLDATQSEARARMDSAWISTLYPGHHAVAVVVTDLAWPHVAGVRFWVARGATIVSYHASEAFLRAVVNRRWTREPDALERAARAGRAPALRFVGVSDSLTLAGGAVRLYAIDGIASQGALMAYLAADRVVWASDFVQTLSAPSEYAREVWQAAQRHRLHPLFVAAEHVSPAPWTRVARFFAR